MAVCWGNFFDENHALAVGREEEVLHIVGFVADLSAVTAVGLHDPKLVAAAFGRKIGDLLFVADFLSTLHRSRCGWKL